MGTLSNVLCILCTSQFVFGDDNEILPYRPIAVDDIITPADFLVISKKLIEKVESPGEGKGIVSSAKNHHQLADKIFQRFFFTNARISRAQALDLSGLDSIQALALSGDEFQPSIHFVPLTIHDFDRGLPLRCRYILIKRKTDVRKGKGLHKKVNLLKTLNTTMKTLRDKREAVSDHSTIRVTRTHVRPDGRRRKNDFSIKPHVIPQAKKLLKNRVMVVQTNRRKRDTNVKDEDKRAHTKPYTYKMYDVDDYDNAQRIYFRPEAYRNTPPEIDKKKCYWQYKCKDIDIPPYSLCGLYPECEDTDSDHFIRDDIPTKHNVDEHDPKLIQFRREVVGVNLIDEEVEKIFYRRYFLILNKQSLKGPPKDVNSFEKKPKESLKTYFQNIIFAQDRKITTAAPPVKLRKNKAPHVYKYLRASNPYGDPKVLQRIKEREKLKAAKLEKIAAKKKTSAVQNLAVISVTRPITTPLPRFMHVI